MNVFLAAFGLGMLFNAAPGAIFAETVKVGVRGGFRPALAVQFGSLVGDALWAVLGLAGIGLLLQLDALRVPIGLAGVAYLLWLSYDSWREAGTQFDVDALSTDGEVSRALRSGMLLSITNPQNIAYWAALGSALGRSVSPSPRRGTTARSSAVSWPRPSCGPSCVPRSWTACSGVPACAGRR